MQLSDQEESSNVEDRRGRGGKGLALGGGLTIIVVVVSLLLGKNPLEMLNAVQNTAQPQQEQTSTNVDKNDPQIVFTRKILRQTELVWGEVFKEMGKQYPEPKLDVFTGQINSACGLASSASGPFYCPGDSKVYIDLSFQDELKNRFGVDGDFPMAYVIAHEVGHHIQNLLGTSAKVQSMRSRLSEKEYNKLSVCLELQADFYAGVWANHAQKMNKILEDGDIEEGLRAATAIGDDTLQKQATGTVVPDAFTHGTSAQRVRWFKKGYETGDIKQGDTFNATSL